MWVARETPDRLVVSATGHEGRFGLSLARTLAPAPKELAEPLSATESLVTFLWRGEHDNVRLFGSPSGNHDPLVRLAGSDVWWASFRMPHRRRCWCSSAHTPMSTKCPRPPSLTTCRPTA